MAESEVRNFKPDPRDLEAMEKRMEKIERSVTGGDRVEWRENVCTVTAV